MINKIENSSSADAPRLWILYEMRGGKRQLVNNVSSFDRSEIEEWARTHLEGTHCEIVAGVPTWGQVCGWFMRLKLLPTDNSLFKAILVGAKPDAKGWWVCELSLAALNTTAWLNRKTLTSVVARLLATGLIRHAHGTGKSTPYRFILDLERLRRFGKLDAPSPYPEAILHQECRQTVARKVRAATRTGQSVVVSMPKSGGELATSSILSPEVMPACIASDITHRRSPISGGPSSDLDPKSGFPISPISSGQYRGDTSADSGEAATPKIGMHLDLSVGDPSRAGEDDLSKTAHSPPSNSIEKWPSLVERYRPV